MSDKVSASSLLIITAPFSYLYLELIIWGITRDPVSETHTHTCAHVHTHTQTHPYRYIINENVITCKEQSLWLDIFPSNPGFAIS